MSFVGKKQQRPKGRGFDPDDRCLGGAHLLSSSWLNMQRKIYEAKPTVKSHFHDVVEDPSASVVKPKPKKSAPSRTSHPSFTQSMARRLSDMRARKRAETDFVTHSHVSNVYHLHRRMEEAYSLTERKKNSWDCSVYPVHLRSTRKSQIVQDTSVWLPDNRRRASSARPSSASRYLPPGPGEGTTEASPYRHLRPSSAHHADRRAGARSTRAAEEDDYATFHDAIMRDILEHRVYEEGALQALFKDWIRLNPPEHRDTVRAVVRDLKEELDVR